MTVEEPSPELLREFEASFEALAQALETASKNCSIRSLVIMAELLDLKEQGDGTPSDKTVWEKVEGDLSLWLRWHSYDGSRPFSIQPDINKLRLEMRQGATVLRRAEASYED